MRHGPCDPWVTAEQIAADPRYCPPGSGSGESDPDLEVLAERATEAMWAATGRRFGVCQATVRPVHRCHGDAYYSESGYGCCDGTDQIPLHAPLVSVDEVKIDGAVFTGWQVWSINQLTRTDSDAAAWPRRQSVRLPDTEPDTFSITYTYGVVPPRQVLAATLELAVQFWLDATGDPHCDLPQGTVSISRQGMSISLDEERVRATSNRVIADAISLQPSQGIPSDIWSPDTDWDLIVVSA